MTPERLADIRQEVRWWLDGKIHKVSDADIEELLAEVDRLTRLLAVIDPYGVRQALAERSGA